MNFKDNNVRVDKAWERLYTRLENDGLLEEQPSKIRRMVHLTAFAKWTGAVAAIVCIVIGIWLFSPSKIQSGPMLTLHNNENAGTLVTTLNDGSLVYLAENTSLLYPKEFAGKIREVYLQGEAYFDVAANKARPFIIETEVAKIEVVGTAFDVKSRDNGAFTLSVKQGEVIVMLKNNRKATHVKAGETVVANMNGDDIQLRQSNDLFNNYKEQIRFKDEYLKNIVNAINKESDSIEIELAPSLLDKQLTITFSDESPESMVKIISLALNLQYSKQGNTIYISPAS